MYLFHLCKYSENLHFNLDKCEVICILYQQQGETKHHPLSHPWERDGYYMYYQGQVLSDQHLQKTIGEPHIDSVCKIANTTTAPFFLPSQDQGHNTTRCWSDPRWHYMSLSGALTST